MVQKILLAGAAGVIGRLLVPLLRDAGHSVIGTTRTVEGHAILQDLGIEALVVDVYDNATLEQAVVAAKPDVIIHQLTDLSESTAPRTQEAAKLNARIRREGTANLVQAARAAGVKRIIAQSIAWAYAPKATPYRETDPLDVAATGTRAISVGEGVIPLESAILDQEDFDGIILRYGQLYGPGTWSNQPDGTSPLHVDAAAYAAFLAVDRGRPGAYNIADPGGAVSIELALTELGWHPSFRREAGVYQAR